MKVLKIFEIAICLVIQSISEFTGCDNYNDIMERYESQQNILGEVKEERFCQ